MQFVTYQQRYTVITAMHIWFNSCKYGFSNKLRIFIFFYHSYAINQCVAMWLAIIATFIMRL